MDSPQMDLRTIIEDARKSSAPPLKTLCVIKYASELCNQQEIRYLLKALKYPNNVKHRHKIKYETEWKTINEIIVDQLNLLPIPKTLKNEVLSYSFSIAVEILKWINAHKNLELPEEFCWTVKGTIDYKNTAKMIINNQSQCIKERYKLACIYCLKTDILLLWIEMSLRDKNYFLNDERNPLVFYWVITLCAPKEEAMLFHRGRTFQVAFLCAVDNGYIDAVKYLLYKLHINSRQIYLDKTFEHIVSERRGIRIRIPEVNETDTWFFLFSHMTEAPQEKYFLNIQSFGIVSQMFLNSSRQKYLIMLMNLASPHLEPFHYCAIGFSLVYKYMMGYKDCDYRKTFIQFWREISNSVRRHLLRESPFGIWLFTHLIKSHFGFLLKEGTMKSKGEHISGYLKSNKLKSRGHFDRDNWKFLSFLIKDQVVTRRLFKRYKRCYLKDFGNHVGKEIAFKKTLILIRRIRSSRKTKVPQINPGLGMPK